MDFNEGIDFIGNERSNRNWQEIIFSKAIEVNPKRPLKKGEAAKFIGMTDLKAFQRKVSTYSIRKFEGGGSKFKNGDTLLARITPCLENGKTALVNILGECEIGFGSTEFIVLSAKQMKSDPFYIYYLVRSPTLRRIIIKSMTGTSGRQRVENSVFDKITLSLPYLSEQSAIGQFLSTFDSKIEINKKMNKNLEAIGQAVFKRWFVDFEFPNEEGKPYKSSVGEIVSSELGEIPIGWSIRKMGNVLELAYGKPLKETTRRRGNIPVYGSNGQIGWHDERLVKGPGIIVGRKGTPGTVVWSNTDFFSIDTTFYVVPKGSVESLNYLFFVLKFQNLASLSADSAVPGLNRKIVYMNDVVVPSQSTLSQFDSIMRAIQNKIESNSEQNLILSEIRDYLLPKLMSGKIRVPVTKEKMAV